MSFFKNIKRFLAPIKKDPIMYIKWICMYWDSAINSIMHVIFLRLITYSLEIQNSELFTKYYIYYWSYIVLYEVIEYVVKYRWWTEILPWSIKIIQKEYLPKLVLLDNNSFEWFWTWKIVAIVEKWMDKWWNLLDQMLYKWLSILVVFIFTSYTLFSSWLRSWLIFLTWYILVHIFCAKINDYMLKYRNHRYEAQNQFTKNLVKIIMSKHEIMQSNKIDKEVKTLEWNLDDMIKANKRMVPYVHLFFRIPSWFVSFFKIAVIIYLWSQILSWTISISILVWVIWSLILMHNAIDDSVRFYKDITKEFTSVQKLWDLFDNTKQVNWFYEWLEFKTTNWNIIINDITYSYNDKSKVFDKFSCEILWNKKTALVWISGSGKTTLVKLIAWYLSLNEWTIEVNGQDIEKTSLQSYYKHIWYLTQEPSVFDWTIKDNLMYAVSEKEITENQLDQVIQLAQCSWIYDLKDWLDTEIGEKWIRLSWWQRQRLAIAKIMLKDPSIVLLDEPTSALDSFAEEEVTKAMNNLFEWRTVIIIAHRLQTVKHADEIIVLWNEEWKVGTQILERWNHESLVNKWWFYAKMLELQSGF